MNFKISRVSGKWYDYNNNEFSLDTNTAQGLIVDAWLKEGNEPVLFEGTPEEIAEQKHYKIEEIRKFQYQELLPTDWYYTRFLETGQEVPLEIKQQRLDIKEKYNNLINQINNE